MIPLSDFSGGLNLRDASGVLDSRFAIDLLNVEFSTRGAILQRPGYEDFTGSAAASRYDAIYPFYTAGGTKKLMASRGTVVEALSAAGSVSTSQTGLSGGPHCFCRFAAPGSELIYVGNGTDKIFKYDGSAFTAPASMASDMPEGKYLAIQSPDNRLVTAGFATTTGGPSGASTNPSTVWFSAAGDPETWGSLDYVHLDPGDGEAITGMAAWGNYLVVFKETKFFVFTGNGEQSDGSPEFIFRPERGVGCVAPGSIVAGRDGIYFLSRSGVYRTTGGEAVPVSTNLDALFGGAELPDFYGGTAINQAAIAGAAGGYWRERLYFSVPTGTSTANDRTLVFDPRFGWWSVYDIGAAAFAEFRPSNDEELLFAYAAGDEKIGRHLRGQTNDAGAAITSRMRTGWFEPANGAETHLRDCRVYGSGVVTVAASVDYEAGTGGGVVADLSAGVDLWADGTDPDDLWADGTDPDDLWGPTATFESKVLTGFGRIGRLYSLSFSNNTLDRSIHVERIHLDFRGSRGANV